MSGTRLRKIATDDGLLFVVFDDTDDVFATPAFRTPVELGAYAEKKGTRVVFNERRPAAEWAEYANSTEYVYPATSADRARFIAAIETLGRGERLLKEEAHHVYDFAEFIEHLVGTSQMSDDVPVPSTVIDGWLTEMGMQLPAEYDSPSYLDDFVLGRAYKNAGLARKVGSDPAYPEGQATPQENILASRYLQALLALAPDFSVLLRQKS